jgi:hypothetical protein
MVGTLMEHVEMTREQKRLEELSDWEMQHLPNGIRIDIPLKSTIHLRKIAPLLRQFADLMERESRRNDITAYQAIERCWMVARSLRREILKICHPLQRD